MSSRLGLMCGTFDPPHMGHLILAETAREQLGLTRVLFVPVGQPPHKQTMTPADLRWRLTAAAVDGNDHFTLDDSDINRSGPHYTATLLPLLQARFPDSELILLMGGDSLRDFPTWHRPQRILEQCRLCVLERPGYDYDWPQLEDQVDGLRAATTILQGPEIHISSTWIREQAAAGQSIRYLVPDPVRQVIESEGVYLSVVRRTS